MEIHWIEITDDSILSKLTGTKAGTQYSVHYNYHKNKWTGEWFDKLEDAKQWLHNLKDRHTQESRTLEPFVSNTTKTWKSRKSYINSPVA
ncbi:MAG: hypothetical protein NUV80_06145 [Candidatus Berkelbacteria bacterium]|nr:hypothetical protein [Candidatus Berkelbacteria bacterium]